MTHFKKLLYAQLNPQCLRGIGIYLGTSTAHHWHRKLAHIVHPNLHRAQWIIVLFTSTILWYSIIFWFQLVYVLLFNNSKKHITFKQIGDLLYLGLWLGASPHNYFTLDLKNTQKPEWIYYIFLEEQLVWYTFFNQSRLKKDALKNDIAVLQDKLAFSNYLLSEELPAIPNLEIFTQDIIQNPEALKKSINQLIHHSEDFFIKPQFSNAMRGCLWVAVNQQSQECTAIGYDIDKQLCQIHNKRELIDFITKSLKNLSKRVDIPDDKKNLLIQKSYVSSNQINNILNTSQAVSLRLITCRQNKNPEMIVLTYAFIEKSMSIKNGKMIWETYNINTQTGKLINQKINGWETITERILAAHSLFQSVKTIAWDVILTEQGLKIIEGNFGWDVISAQRVSNTPTLKTAFSLEPHSN